MLPAHAHVPNTGQGIGSLKATGITNKELVILITNTLCPLSKLCFRLEMGLECRLLKVE